MKNILFFAIAALVLVSVPLAADALSNPIAQRGSDMDAPKEMAPQDQSQAMPARPVPPQAGSPQMGAPQDDTVVTSPNEVRWSTNFARSQARAEQENKPLFLYFTGSDWCGWCKKMDTEIFTTRDFVTKTADRFVFVLIDRPMSHQLPADLAQQNESLRARFGVTGYPTVILLDPHGNFIAQVGYRQGGGSAYADYVISLL